MSCFGFGRKKQQPLPSPKTVVKPGGKSQILSGKQYIKFKPSVMNEYKDTKIQQQKASRDQNYAILTNKTQASKVFISRQELNFQMDEQNGISGKLQINHFVYDSLVQGKYGLTNNKIVQIKLERDQHQQTTHFF